MDVDEAVTVADTAGATVAIRHTQEGGEGEFVALILRYPSHISQGTWPRLLSCWIGLYLLYYHILQNTVEAHRAKVTVIVCVPAYCPYLLHIYWGKDVYAILCDLSFV